MEVKVPNFIKEPLNAIKDYLCTKWKAVKMKPEDSFDEEFNIAQESEDSNIERPEMGDALCSVDRISDLPDEAQESQDSNIERPEMEDALCSVDRISDLPIDVLIRILSLLSTKEAAPTFMLSKRWNNIWTSLPCLKFYSSEFPYEDELSEVCNAKFNEFVNGVLRNRGTTPVDKFELEFCREISPDHPAMEWVDHIVVNCKPRVLRLDTYLEDYNCNYEIPTFLFSCASLEEVELEFCSDFTSVRLPEQVYLPSLKKLILSGAIYVVNGFFEKLCSGSCLLEKVVLSSCRLESTLQISSSLLKHFDLLLYCDRWVDVEIDAPSLIYLDIQSHKSARIFLKNLRSLVDAQVHIYGSDVYRPSKFTGNLKNISALANATTLDLKLSGDVMKENLEKELFNFPTFINLKTLVLGEWCMVNDFDLVAAFLEHSPNLQMLKLSHLWRETNQGEIARGALFLKEYLQTVVIDGDSIDGAIEVDKNHGIWLFDETEEDMKAKRESVDLLVKQLRACVRTIGEINIRITQRQNYID